MTDRTLRVDGTETHHLPKAKTGIAGFDEITIGGLPRNRVSLVFGPPGSGKTMLLLTFAAKGAGEFQEPAVFVSFEEAEEELLENSANLGMSVAQLVQENKLVIDYVGARRQAIQESGSYDLSPLFARIGAAIDSIGAKRVVIDSLEALFSDLRNRDLLRGEIRKLFHWLRGQGVTAVVTAEKGGERMTRHGFEEYASDCVVMLDSRIENNVTTRYLRIVKYRGSVHRTNEYPFMIYDDGLSVLPLSSAYLDYEVSTERVSTGVSGLDQMCGGQGYFRGSTVLLSGTSGTGKTSIASAFAVAACERGENALYYALEESRAQIARNMRSIGIELDRRLESDRLTVSAVRSTHLGIETHLVKLEQLVSKLNPSVVVLDAVSDLLNTGSSFAAKSMLIRAIDFLKHRGITTLLTSLVPFASNDATVQISSFIDTWIVLENQAANGVLRRTARIVKSRGMSHSHQLAEFRISDSGLVFRRDDGAAFE